MSNCRKKSPSEYGGAGVRWTPLPKAEAPTEPAGETSGKMNEYLTSIDKQAEELFSRLVKQLAERDAITEALKATDQMAWVQRMNAVKAQATEIVNSKLFYT